MLSLYHRVHGLFFFFFCHNYFIHVFGCFHLKLSFSIKLVGNGLCGDDYLPMKAKKFVKMENPYSLQAIKFVLVSEHFYLQD